MTPDTRVVPGKNAGAKAAGNSRSRSLLSITDLDLPEVADILSLATALEVEDPLLRARRLAKRRVALLFYESSTRTRTSFELAAKSLGADTALISSQSSSIEKGESLKDTGITLRALGAECIILRHLFSGSPYLLQQSTNLPVLNAGDGTHEHPSQALLDLRTILTAFELNPNVDEKTLAGMTVTIAGDILHSRVARSNALLLPRLGARLILCGPPALLPETALQLGPGIEIERDFDRALQQSQVVMMLRIQKERLAGLQIDLDEYVSRYQLHEERLAGKAPKAIVMHPGPMIRGLEISSPVADGPQSVISQQVHHGVAIRMALVYRALAGVSTAPADKAPSPAAAASSGAPRAPAKAAAPAPQKAPQKSPEKSAAKSGRKTAPPKQKSRKGGRQ